MKLQRVEEVSCRNWAQETSYRGKKKDPWSLGKGERHEPFKVGEGGKAWVSS